MSAFVGYREATLNSAILLHNIFRADQFYKRWTNFTGNFGPPDQIYDGKLW